MKLTQKIAVSYLRLKFRVLAAFSPKLAAKQAFDLFCTPPTRDVKRLPPAFLKAEELGFKFGEYRIVGYRWNKGGSKRVMILHGFESTAINFERYIGPLVEKGYEVLAFDAPAHGRSTGKRITGIVYKDMVKYVMDQYGPLHSAMGHSFGGFVLCLALAETPHDQDFRAVLIAPSSETKTAIDNFFSFFHLDGRIRPEFEKIIVDRSGHPVAWFTVARALKDIRARVLWLHDEGDNITPYRDALKVKNENYPNLRFVTTKGLGHSRIYRDPAVAEQVVAFM